MDCVIGVWVVNPGCKVGTGVKASVRAAAGMGVGIFVEPTETKGVGVLFNLVQLPIRRDTNKIIK